MSRNGTYKRAIIHKTAKHSKTNNFCGQVGSAPACYGNSLGSNPDLSKIQKGRHKQRSGQHTLARKKNIKTKKTNSENVHDFQETKPKS